jgi:hypothetical protein
MIPQFIRKAIRYEPGEDDNLLEPRQAVELAGGARRNAMKLS